MTPTSDARLANGYDAEAMDLLFPPDASSLVLWMICSEIPTPTAIDVTVKGPRGPVFRDSFTVPHDGEDSYDLIVDLDVDPGATYLLEVSSSILETTDLTTGSPTRFECTRELTAGAGTATAVTIASSNLCFGITAPQWRTTTGDPVSPGEIHESSGPTHCNWDQIQFLTVGSFFATAYVRDVDSRFDSTYYTPGGLGQGGQDTTDDTVGTSGTTAYAGETLAFAVLDQLPDEAVDSQYRTAGRELFWSKSGDYVFMRTEGAMERWPLISPRPLCI